MDFADAIDHTLNIKENDKTDKFLNLARELKKQWNMKLTVILIVIGSLETIPLKQFKFSFTLPLSQLEYSLTSKLITFLCHEFWGLSLF